MKSNKIPFPGRSSTRISGKSNEAYSTINREVINNNNTSISFQGNKISAQSMKKSDFQRSATPKNQSEQISTYTNYSSHPPHKIYYHKVHNNYKTQTQNIQDYRETTQSFEKLGTKISSSSPQVFEQDINKVRRAVNQPNEQLATKKDIESLEHRINQTINKMNGNIFEIAKEIGTQIGIKIGTQMGQMSKEIGIQMGQMSKEIGTQMSKEIGTQMGQMSKEIGIQMGQMSKEIGTQMSKEIGTQMGQMSKEIGIQMGQMSKEIVNQMGQIGKGISEEIGKVISNKFTVISQNLSDISKKIDSNSSNGSLGRSKNNNGNTSIHSFAKDSLENDSSGSHYNYKKRNY